MMYFHHFENKYRAVCLTVIQAGRQASIPKEDHFLEILKNYRLEYANAP